VTALDAGAPAPVTGQGPTSPRRLPVGLAVAGVTGLGSLLVLALVVGGGGAATSTAGVGGPGLLVDWGLPVVTLAGRVAALGTVGTALFAAVLLPGPVLRAASRRAVRAASWWAASWAATAVLHALLTVSEVVGVPPTALTGESIRAFLTQLPAGDAAVGVLAASVAVALGARRCTSSDGAVVLLLIAVAGVVVPAVLTGHAATEGGHVLAVTTMAVHVAAASVWVGGLLAVLLHGREPGVLPGVMGRFSAVALVSAAAVGGSGLLAAWLVLDDGAGLPGGLLSGYGLLLVGKTTALAALLTFGWHHRRRTLPDLHRGLPQTFRRMATLEVGVMLATVALAVALAASPPPAAAVPASTSAGTSAGPATAPPDTAPPPVHDHGDLSVPVLVDPTGFTVTEPVAPGAVVTVHNPTDTGVTVTADDGSFDAVIPAGSLTSFRAPDRAGVYPFVSRHAPGFTGLLVVG
jgi:putative copper export protein